MTEKLWDAGGVWLSWSGCAERKDVDRQDDGRACLEIWCSLEGGPTSSVTWPALSATGIGNDSYVPKAYRSREYVRSELEEVIDLLRALHVIQEDHYVEDTFSLHCSESIVHR